MEKLKPLVEVLAPDPRQRGFMRYDPDLRTYRPRTLNDFYSSIEDIELNPGAPDGVQTQFNTAKNLFVYSWFVYGFAPISDFMAYSALECALRERSEREGLNVRRKSLGQMLKMAIEHSWIQDDGIRHHRRIETRRRETVKEWEEMGFVVQPTLSAGPRDYCTILQKSFSDLRNSLAHGQGLIYPPSSLTLELCADLINQLFPAL